MTTNSPLNHTMSAINSWFITPNLNNKAIVRLFCFHCAGGDASTFYPWAKKINSSIELISIQLPGHGMKFDEPKLRSMEAIIAYLNNAILPYFDRPYFFFGHSLGALVAFELTRSLQKNCKPLPECLFVAGKNPPHIRDQKFICHLSDQEIIEEIKKYNGIPAEILAETSLMNIFLPIFRADFEVLETYVYYKSLPLTCNLIALGGVEDPIVKAVNIEAWKIHTSGKFQSYLLTGDHFFIKSQQPEVLEIIYQTIQPR